MFGQLFRVDWEEESFEEVSDRDLSFGWYRVLLNRRLIFSQGQGKVIIGAIL